MAAGPYYEIGDYDDVGLVLPYAGVKEGEVVCEVFRFKLIDKKYYDAGLVFGGLRRSLVDEGKIETNANLRLIESRLQTTLQPSQLSGPHRLFSFGVPEIRRLMSEGKAAYRRDVAQYEIDTRNQFRNPRYPVYRNYGDFAKLDAHIEELRKARVSMGLTQGVPIKSYLADLRAAHALETARHTS